MKAKEEQIAVSILEGKTIPYCSQYYGVAKHRCITLVNRYCSITNRPLYDTLRSLPCELVAPITQLRKHSKAFIRYHSDEDAPKRKNISTESIIWDLSGVQILTLNALWENKIRTVADLLKYDERRLLRLPKLGKIGLQQLKDILKKHGYFLAVKKRVKNVNQIMPERDWKCMKRLRDELLACLCKRITAQAVVILAEPEASEHKKYLKLFEHMQTSDRIVAECFDDWRRSTLFMKIHAMHRNGILEAKHILLLSDETQQRLELMKGL